MSSNPSAPAFEVKVSMHLPKVKKVLLPDGTEVVLRIISMGSTSGSSHLEFKK